MDWCRVVGCSGRVFKRPIWCSFLLKKQHAASADTHQAPTSLQLSVFTHRTVSRQPKTELKAYFTSLSRLLLHGHSIQTVWVPGGVHFLRARPAVKSLWSAYTQPVGELNLTYHIIFLIFMESELQWYLVPLLLIITNSHRLYRTLSNRLYCLRS